MMDRPRPGNAQTPVPDRRHRARRVAYPRTTAALALAIIALVGVPANAQAASRTAPSPEGHPSYIACTMWGTDGDDTIIGTPGDDVLCGQGGNDVIYGQGGNDDIYGGPGKDIIVAGDTVEATDGVPVSNLYGDPGDDTIRGGADSEWISGGLGNDQIQSGGGGDVVWGDEYEPASVTGPGGNDTIYTGDGNDGVFGGSGDDYINTGTNTQLDSAEGNAGNDVIIGGPGAADEFWGNAGNDLLFPSPLRANTLGNTVIGGAGNDIAILANGMPDGFTKGDPNSVSVPIEGCSVSVPLTDSADTKNWGLSCPLIGPVSLSVKGSSSTVKVSSSFYGASVSWSPARWKAFLDGNLGTVSADICACDPPIGTYFTGDRIS